MTCKNIEFFQLSGWNWREDNLHHAEFLKCKNVHIMHGVNGLLEAICTAAGRFPLHAVLFGIAVIHSMKHLTESQCLCSRRQTCFKIRYDQLANQPSIYIYFIKTNNITYSLCNVLRNFIEFEAGKYLDVLRKRSPKICFGCDQNFTFKHVNQCRSEN